MECFITACVGRCVGGMVDSGLFKEAGLVEWCIATYLGSIQSPHYTSCLLRWVCATPGNTIPVTIHSRCYSTPTLA